PSTNVADRAKFLALLEGRKTVSFSGHTHTTEHHYFGVTEGFMASTPHHHHVLTAVSGSWWSGPLDRRGIASADSRDGTPHGFHILSVAHGGSYTTRYVPPNEPNGDTGGEFAITLGSPPQGLEVGASRFCSWSAGPPRVHPDQIDCDGGGDMLQACLRDPDIAASPQSAATDRLFMCSLNACACGVTLFEIFRRLMLSGGLQRLMMLTRLQSNDAGLSLGFGALGPQRTRRTILGGKSYLEHSAVLRIGVW